MVILIVECFKTKQTKTKKQCRCLFPNDCNVRLLPYRDLSLANPSLFTIHDKLAEVLGFVIVGAAPAEQA